MFTQLQIFGVRVSRPALKRNEEVNDTRLKTFLFLPWITDYYMSLTDVLKC